MSGDFGLRRLRSPAGVIALVIATGLLTGCVSSTLQSAAGTTSNAQLKAETPPKEPTYDLALREEAVTQMRAKADNKSGEKTDVFRNQDGPATPLAKGQANADIKRLDAESKQQQNVIPDAELTAKQRSIAEMRRKLANHYKDALNKIEN